jgi:amino acid transporter
MPATRIVLKRALLGRPRASRELKHQLLPKRLALPVFASDPLSSVAYATQEMMLVLALAGASAFVLVQPLSLGVAALLAIVVVSYRQTVRAYPHGGGAYIVARENLGETPGLLAAGALLIDYTLTVSVSVAAGVAAIVSAAPWLAEHRVALSLAFVALVTVANLRGVREAGALFAVPTYLFVVTMLALIVTGAVRCVGGCPQAASAGVPLQPEHGLTLFLLLRAFASGATALTGVEAISNGVGAFRYPQSRNAATTLGVMGLLAVTLFLGTSFLATGTGVVAYEGMERTVVAQIALVMFGDGAGFYLVQGVTAAILILAANTSYADFPRLSSVLANDRYLPRQLASRGDRLVFSNGILVLALVSSLLLVAFSAEVTRLVQLYVVGVFTSFTLSQAGMVRRHLRLRQSGWQRSALLNAAGAATTALVLVVVAVTKFAGGAWLVLVGIPSAAFVMRRISRHYAEVRLHLAASLAEPERVRPNHAVILLDRVDEVAARALSYAQAVGAASISALGIPQPGSDLERRWAALGANVPLRVLQPADSAGAPAALHRALREEARRHPDAFTTAIVPETLSRGWYQQLHEHRLALRVKSRLYRDRDLVVTDLTSPPGGPGPYTVEDPAAHHVVVLIGALNAAAKRALAYADGLQPTSVRALWVNVGTERSAALLEQWDDWDLRTPLELVDSPFRDLSDTVRGYVRRFRPDGRHVIVTCVLPEFRLTRWWHQPLHNQTALLLKRGVVTTSVPFPLPVGERGARAPGGRRTQAATPGPRPR